MNDKSLIRHIVFWMLKILYSFANVVSRNETRVQRQKYVVSAKSNLVEHPNNLLRKLLKIIQNGSPTVIQESA